MLLVASVRTRVVNQLPRVFPTSAKSAVNNSRKLSTSRSILKLKQVGAQNALPLVATCLAVGFLAGRTSLPADKENDMVIPNGFPRTCCDALELTEDQVELSKKIKSIVGNENVLDGRVETTKTSKYLKGARLGKGSALCIVNPTSLTQLVDIVQAAVDADCVVLAQGSNTGLTGGSVPRENADNRPTVLISMKKFDTIFPIDNGEKVVCLAGAGLATLQKYVQTNFPGRESHSILGSTFLNPTAAAGIALGSGGTQCRKGPAYTDRALYLKVFQDEKTGKKKVTIVNTLGVEGLDQQEGECSSCCSMKDDGVIPSLASHVEKVKNGKVSTSDMKTSNSTFGKEAASDVGYKNRICEHNHEVSRCNADTRGRECNRSEGKVMILASVHDTFKSPSKAKTFWVSFDSLESALSFRRKVCLDNPKDLPVSMEYMDRDSFDVIDNAGRILGHTIKKLGTSSSTIGDLWNVKIWVEALPFRGSSTLPDKLLYYANGLFSPILPDFIMDVGKKMDHHVAMTVGDFDGSMDRFLSRMEDFQTDIGKDKMVVNEITSKKDQAGLTAFRFVAAPAFRTWCVGQGVQGFSVDYALPKNAGEAPPIASSSAPLKRMRYSHFACNVVHEDVAFAPGLDVDAIKLKLKESVEHDCHGKLPAEHGHGTEYHAPKETKKRWMKMDPLNVMNPGVGGLATTAKYKDDLDIEDTIKEELTSSTDTTASVGTKKRSMWISLGPLNSVLRRFQSHRDH